MVWLELENWKMDQSRQHGIWKQFVMWKVTFLSILGNHYSTSLLQHCLFISERCPENIEVLSDLKKKSRICNEMAYHALSSPLHVACFWRNLLPYSLSNLFHKNYGVKIMYFMNWNITWVKTLQTLFSQSNGALICLWHLSPGPNGWPLHLLMSPITSMCSLRCVPTWCMYRADMISVLNFHLSPPPLTMEQFWSF